MNRLAAQIIQEHYGLDRHVTTAEVQAEIDNLWRKYHKGNLDTDQEYLAAKLHLFAGAPLPDWAAV